jgi:3-deoxy-D-arabino-heptulosonate 7-phosphate (DAHP) synthase
MVQNQNAIIVGGCSYGETNMSLQQAKRLADIRGEIEAASEKVSARLLTFKE